MRGCRGSGAAIAIAVGGLLLAGAAGNAQEEPRILEEHIWGDYALDDESVGRLAREALPFTPEQMRSLGRLLDQTRAARAVAAGAPPQGRIRAIAVNAGSSEEIPGIRLHQGYVTVVSFTDLTGQPWPIEEVLVDQRFLRGEAAEAVPGDREHLLYLVPQERYLHGNLVVKLRDLAEPVLMTLRDGDGVADFRVDARLGDAGPNADIAALARPESFHAGDELLQDLLGGRIPEGAVSLDVEGGSTGDRAWAFDGDVLLLTRWLVLSPGPWAAERGAGGRQAYRLPDTPRVLVSRQGREATLRFKRRGSVEALIGSGG